MRLDTNTNCRTVVVTTLAGAARADALAIEEPLEIRLGHGPLTRRSRTRLTITLRTPGCDRELVFGLLLSEGVIHDAADVIAIDAVGPNLLHVDLAPTVAVDPTQFQRSFASTSSCGLCGRTMLDAIEAACEPVASTLIVDVQIIHRLPGKLRAAQLQFAQTGGVHAAGLFDAEGGLLSVREDVGRHNAVDKVLGAELAAGRCRLPDRVLVVSGRAGYELVQKAARFGVPVMAAVGAPTTLAVDLAHALGVTLLGFVRDGRGNCYSHPERLRFDVAR